MLGKSISRNSLLLGAFALLTAAILAGVNQLTSERIAAAERDAAQKALLEILPAGGHNNDLLNDTLAIPVAAINALGTTPQDVIYLARLNQTTNTVIVPAVAPDGYSGKIRMIVGVNRDHSIAGVRVLTHKETPGLGDKVDTNKSNWILGFAGLSLANPASDVWKVKKDGGNFDQFTGATITPRATVKQVKKVLQFVEQHHQLLFNSNVQPDKAHRERGPQHAH